MDLVEYLYVDEKRLDAYFEQISSPVTYDKVPVWEASLTITSPGAKGSQQRFARPYTTHEKISKLTEYLEDKGFVGYGRASGQNRGATFQIETCRAKRVFIPPNHGQPPEVGTLNLWISAVPRTREEIEAILERGRSEGIPFSSRGPGNLYLLEDYRYADVGKSVFDISPYSAISLMLANDAKLPEDHSPYRRYFSNLIRPNWNNLTIDPSWVDPDTPDKLEPSVKEQLEQMDLPDEQKKAAHQGLAFSSSFLVDPAAALAQIGAQIGPERKIRTLYRVRAYFAEEELAWNYDQWDLATFGYPIFIAEATDGA